MYITYLDHSGFVAQIEDQVVLVFDYYRDPAHALEKILRHKPDVPVVFLVSHHHPDHFNPDIFNLAQDHKRLYILSNDIFSRVVPDNAPANFLAAGDLIENQLGDIAVRAFGSTDEGVSFLVTTKDGRRLFHAGDLNNWHWGEESTPREVEKANNAFMTIVRRIAEAVATIDVAFFPVDTRQGKDFNRGAAEFVDTVRVANFIPMHFWGKDSEACDFAAYPLDKPVQTNFICLHKPGESVEIK